MLKGSKIKSIVTGCCPKCHKQNMYLNKNPFKLLDLYKMHSKCSHCGTVFQVEPAFFYGAMYVSYALGVALGIAIFVIGFFLLNWNLKQSFVAITIALIFFMPLLIRLARNIWINFFIHYEKKYDKN